MPRSWSLNITEIKKIIKDTANSSIYKSEPLENDTSFILLSGLSKKYPCK